MLARFKHRSLSVPGSLLDRLLVWSGALLVLAVVGFGAYYYLDRQGKTRTPSLTEQTIARFEQAVRATPGDVSARISLGDLYYTNHRYAESAVQYQAALEIKPDSVLTLMGLGRALLATGDRAGAIQHLTKVIDLTKNDEIPGDVTQAAQYYLGRAYLDQQRPADAVEHLKVAVAISRMDADAWELLGTAFLADGKVDEAINALSTAVRYVPNYTEAYQQLAAAYERKGQAPQRAYALGMVAYGKGKFAEAADQLEAAVKGASAFANAYVGLGLVREARNERAQAVAAFQQALRLEPDNFNAQAGVSRLTNSKPPPHATAGPKGVTP